MKGSKSLDELLGEITVDGPEQRALGNVNSDWPGGWWAVSDEHHGYIAYVQFEELAWALRLSIINARMNLGHLAQRYRKKDKEFVVKAAESKRRTVGVLSTQIQACPILSLAASHYNPDGTCKCAKPKKRSLPYSKRAP